MKRLTIVKDDSVVGIDGLFLTVDCSTLPENFHALQWYGDESEGEVEWKGKPKPVNTIITSIAEYQSYVDAWNIAKQAYDAMIAAGPDADLNTANNG